MKLKRLNGELIYEDPRCANHGELLKSALNSGVSDFSEADFRGANFMYADFMYADFSRTDFSDSDFRFADFMHVSFSDANFSNTSFSNANFSDADFSRANFRRANFRRANFMHADFMYADFRYVIGDGKLIKTTQARWDIVRVRDILAIGCKQYSVKEWEAFTDEEIKAMDSRALHWWREWKPKLLGAS